MASEKVADTDVALLALIVALLADGLTAVMATLKRNVIVLVALGARVLLMVQVTVVPTPPACVHPLVVGAPVTSVKPVGAESVSVVTFATEVPALPYSRV